MASRRALATALVSAAFGLAACADQQIDFQEQPTLETLPRFEAMLAAAGPDPQHLPFLEREYIARVATRVGELQYRQVEVLPECESKRVRRELPSTQCDVIEYTDLKSCRRYVALKRYLAKTDKLPDYQRSTQDSIQSVARINLTRYELYQDYQAALESGTKAGLEAFIARYGLHKDAATLMFPEPCELTEVKDLWESFVVREAELRERRLRDSGDADWLDRAIESWKKAVSELPFGVTREKALNRQRALELEKIDPDLERKTS